MSKKTPSERLRTWRAGLEISQAEAAAKLDIGQQAFGDLERGAATPRLATAIRIRDVVGIELEAWT